MRPNAAGGGPLGRPGRGRGGRTVNDLDGDPPDLERSSRRSRGFNRTGGPRPFGRPHRRKDRGRKGFGRPRLLNPDLLDHLPDNCRSGGGRRGLLLARFWSLPLPLLRLRRLNPSRRDELAHERIGKVDAGNGPRTWR